MGYCCEMGMLMDGETSGVVRIMYRECMRNCEEANIAVGSLSQVTPWQRGVKTPDKILGGSEEVVTSARVEL